MLMVLVFVLKWVKGVLRCSLYGYHLSDNTLRPLHFAEIHSLHFLVHMQNENLKRNLIPARVLGEFHVSSVHLLGHKFFEIHVHLQNKNFSLI